MEPRVHAFVDGGYLLALGKELDVPYPHITRLLNAACWSQHLRLGLHGNETARLLRITFYDAAAPSEGGAKTDDVQRDRYRKAIELLPDVHLGFGYLRRSQAKAREQKGVDTLMAVDMVVGAFNRIFDIAMLVSGDGDFVPVVEEIGRRGVTTVLVAGASPAEELRRAVDRHVVVVAKGNPHDDKHVHLNPLDGF